MLGGTAAGSANVISGNTDDGISVLNAGTTGNSIVGNIIGRDPTNTSTIANAGDGIQVSSTRQRCHDRRYRSRRREYIIYGNT